MKVSALSVWIPTLTLALLATPVNPLVASTILTRPNDSSWSAALDAILRAVEKNATLTLLGLLIASFAAGFGVRKHFEDRRLSNLQVQNSELQRRCEDTKKQAEEAAAKTKSKAASVKSLAEFLSPDFVRERLEKHLKQFPEESHKAIVAAVVRQLLLAPGTAWLPTPECTIFIKAEFDYAKGVPKFSTTIDKMQFDPANKLRELLKGSDQLNGAILDLAIHGLTNVSRRTSPTEIVVLTVVQGPDSQWFDDEKILARISSGSEG